MSRRKLLLGAAGTAASAGVAGTAWLMTRPGEAAGRNRIMASSDEVRRAERARRGRGTGRTVRAALTAEPAEVDLGGRTVSTWAYHGQVPGPVVRCTAGDRLEVALGNRLPEESTVHWHGLRLRNDMDGVPHLTQAPVPAGGRMRYTFTAPDPGTYWFHPHVGLQRERGLFAPLIIDDPREVGDYDAEFVVVLDDWLDGAGPSPRQVLSRLRGDDDGPMARDRIPVQAGKIEDRSGEWRYNAPLALASPRSGKRPISVPSRLASHIDFPIYLLNGRLPTAPHTFRARPGQRARIRLISAAGATVFRVALGGHRLTVTHTDGFPVEPVTVDTLQVASGERYDLLVTLKDGAFPLVGVAEGKNAQALGVVRTAAGSTPPDDVEVPELAGRLLALTQLRATPAVRADDHAPDHSHMLYLTGDMATFAWRINSKTYHPRRPFDGIAPLAVRAGQRIRLVMVNQTPMYHPMHLHGHTFAVRSAADTGYKNTRELADGTRKDTLMVPPGQSIGVDFTADNPGQWLVHCHNAYHLATGMATIVSYMAAP